MADAEIPPTQETTVDKLRNYVKNNKGIILLTEIVLSFIIIICFACSIYGGYIVVAIYELVSTLIIFFIFALELQKTFSFINFLWTDFFRAISSCIILFIISMICVAGRWSDTPQITGGVIGLLTAMVYGYDTYIILTEIKLKKSQNSGVLVMSV